MCSRLQLLCPCWNLLDLQPHDLSLFLSTRAHQDFSSRTQKTLLGVSKQRLNSMSHPPTEQHPQKIYMTQNVCFFMLVMFEKSSHLHKNKQCMDLYDKETSIQTTHAAFPTLSKPQLCTRIHKNTRQPESGDQNPRVAQVTCPEDHASMAALCHRKML